MRPFARERVRTVARNPDRNPQALVGCRVDAMRGERAGARVALARRSLDMCIDPAFGKGRAGLASAPAFDGVDPMTGRSVDPGKGPGFEVAT